MPTETYCGYRLHYDPDRNSFSVTEECVTYHEEYRDWFSDKDYTLQHPPRLVCWIDYKDMPEEYRSSDYIGLDSLRKILKPPFNEVIRRPVKYEYHEHPDGSFSFTSTIERELIVRGFLGSHESFSEVESTTQESNLHEYLAANPGKHCELTCDVCSGQSTQLACVITEDFADPDNKFRPVLFCRLTCPRLIPPPKAPCKLADLEAWFYSDDAEGLFASGHAGHKSTYYRAWENRKDVPCKYAPTTSVIYVSDVWDKDRNREKLGEVRGGKLVANHLLYADLYLEKAEKQQRLEALKRKNRRH